MADHDEVVRTAIEAQGEAERRGSDYFGAVLNYAARVMACGHGGRILLDGQTVGLLCGVDPTSFPINWSH